MQATINPSQPKNTIDRNIYGHFAEHLGRCIYEGLYVGEASPIEHIRGIRQDVVSALKHVQIPVLRWPGGCFADDYHWMDGIGPKEKRPRMVNVHWGGVTENNHFGTHEFYDACEQIGCEPYICGNVGSGTVKEMRDWVEYITFEGISPMADLRAANGQKTPWKLPYFGVGNENWGCGGDMRPEYYADLYRRYASYVRNFSGKTQRIACGPSGQDTHWTRVLMAQAGKYMDGLSLHYYTTPFGWTKRGSALDFDEAYWAETFRQCLRIDPIIQAHLDIMDEYDPEKRVSLIVDEWGTWYDVEPGTNPGFLYQQNTMRDALVAALSLHVFHKHSSRVRMANIAQTINVLQALILTEGARILKTPTYHVFDLFKVHQNASLLDVTVTDTPSYEGLEAVSASASVNADGKIHISLCNVDPRNAQPIEITLKGITGKPVSGHALYAQAMNQHNTFDEPDTLTIKPLSGISLCGEHLTATLPPMSVSVLAVG